MFLTLASFFALGSHTLNPKPISSGLRSKFSRGVGAVAVSESSSQISVV